MGTRRIDGFFIVPDMGVAFVAAMSPRNWWKAALASIVGTLVGAVVLFVAIQFWLGAHAAHLLLLLAALSAMPSLGRSPGSHSGPDSRPDEHRDGNCKQPRGCCDAGYHESSWEHCAAAQVKFPLDHVLVGRWRDITPGHP